MKKFQKLLLAISLLVIIVGCVPPKQPQIKLPVELPLIKNVESIVLVPKVMSSASKASLTITTLSRNQAANAKANIKLIADSGKEIQLFDGETNGHVSTQFDVPDLENGRYKIIASVGDDELEGQVEIRKGAIILIETDKPIYKPSQTIHGRVVLLNNQLKPLKSTAEVSITDGKGVKIFKKELDTNEYGVASFDLDLASEVNFGTWKITASSGDSSTTVDIRVERYVLPKFKLDVSTVKDWFLVDEEIKGIIKADYFFGKPVDGDVMIRALRYVGVWEEYETYNVKLHEGKLEFTLPKVEYVSGTPGAGGAGSLMLNITVTDTSGHEEKTTKLLKIVESDIVMQLIPDSNVIKPDLPFQVLVVTESPDDKPLSKDVKLTAYFHDKESEQLAKEEKTVATKNGLALITFEAPEKVAKAQITASIEGTRSSAELSLYAAYSPTSNFIHLVQSGKPEVKVGDTISFNVYSTSKGTIYYDVFASGHTVFSDTSSTNEITFQVTPAMSPKAKVIAYKINPNSEVSADSIPFDVELESRANLEALFNKEVVAPGDDVTLKFNTDIESMIGFSIVDESVYALNEGRLNLKQVFDELEKRFMEPQAEAHPEYWSIQETKGPIDIFNDNGMMVLSSKELKVPKGEEFERDKWELVGIAEEAGMMRAVTTTSAHVTVPQGLAEPTRVRQFFPETWVWKPDLLTDSSGNVELSLTAPDSITTWKLHAVSTSQNGLGIAESELKVFQDFFVEPDLPYAVTRNEEFPIKIQIFNYLDKTQKVYIELSESNWFTLLDVTNKEIDVEANAVKSVSYKIKPTKLGIQKVKITARTNERADAIEKEIIIEPEGSRRESVLNGILKANSNVKIDTTLSKDIVEGSGKILLSITPSIVAQTIEGVDDLLAMPYGCGEQNMILFAPDVEVLRYLKFTGQLTPEVQAKSEHFITTGYQRELTFRHNDGSFSAFGESDQEGSLWLTAFVLNTFSGARDVAEIDENILSSAAKWLEDHQKDDGSFEPVGFVHHSEMVGGSASGNFALTSFTAIALAEYGDTSKSIMDKTKEYLEDELGKIDNDAYALAIGSLALLKLESDEVNDAVNKLLQIAKQDDNGMYWEVGKGQNVETAAYAALTLIEMKRAEANSVLKWIASQRNSRGGFSTTQDTVMAFKALMNAAKVQSRDIDVTVIINRNGEKYKEIKIDKNNFDVLQVYEIPVGSDIELVSEGSGDINYQVAKRFNVLLAGTPVIKDMEMDVQYSANHVDVDDIVDIKVKIKFVGLAETSGMVIADVAVPTGFEPVVSSLEEIKANGKISRYELAGRKMILYISDMKRGVELTFDLQVKAKYPVKAIIPNSKVYSYYDPDIKAEVEGGSIEVS